MFNCSSLWGSSLLLVTLWELAAGATLDLHVVDVRGAKVEDFQIVRLVGSRLAGIERRPAVRTVAKAPPWATI